MRQTEDFCLVCGETCTCQTKSTKRRSARAKQPIQKPLDTPHPASSAEHQPERRSPRRVAGRSATEGVTEENDEDTSMITAIRALAHLVNPEDLEPFAEHLMPSDYLPPAERAASWRRKIVD